jgi:hypothetical protein
MNNKKNRTMKPETKPVFRLFLALFVGLFIFLFAMQANTNAHAAWSGGSIDARVSSGTTAFLGNGASINMTGSATSITARYNNVYAGALWHLGVLQEQNYAPIITLLSPADGTMTKNTTLNLSYRVIDQNDNPLNCTLYHSTNPAPTYYSSVNTTSWSTITTGITSGDGAYYWYVTCSDGTNTTQSATRNYTIDTTPPTITLYHPEQNIITKNETTSFQYMVNETNEVENCTLYTNETGSWQAMQSELLPLKDTTINFQETLGDAYYKWGIECSDSLGNAGWSENRTFEQNRLFPGAVSGLINTSNRNSSIAWNWTNPTDYDFAGTILYIDGVNTLNLSPVNSSYVLTGLQGETTHTLTINTYDSAGNINLTNATNTATTMPGILNVSSVITIQSPVPNVTLTTTNITLEYNVSNPEEVSWCAIYVDSSVAANHTNISTETTNIIAIPGVAEGVHNLAVSCASFYGKLDSSNIMGIRILNLNGFDGSTTDLTSVNISQVTDFTLEKSSSGKIIFPGVVDLSSATNIPVNIILSDKTVTVNSGAIPVLNRTAILEIYNVPYTNIAIWKDGQICQNCEIISKIGNTLTFNVTGFSTYVVTSSSALNITDDTQTSAKYANESIMFYASYTNITSSSPITGSCDISINDGGWSAPAAMTYNSTLGEHTYEYTFTTVNSFPYNITCTPTEPGFDELSAVSAAETSPLATGTQQFVPTNITTVSSSSFSPTTPTQTIATSGGNVSEVHINAIIGTDSWQGYYGNITSNTLLADPDQHIMFRWNDSINKGQVFASRNNSIAWDTVNCAADAQVAGENTYLGKTGTEKDSVNNTYSVRNHPHFVVGSRLIQNCPSTALGNGTSNNFWNVLIGDSEGAGNLVYTGLINSDAAGFKNQLVDFELLVPVNGKTESVTPYYFYLELD